MRVEPALTARALWNSLNHPLIRFLAGNLRRSLHPIRQPNSPGLAIFVVEPGVGVEPTSATAVDVYYGLLRGVSAARRLNRSAFGGQANPGLVWPPAKTISQPRIV